MAFILAYEYMNETEDDPCSLTIAFESTAIPTRVAVGACATTIRTASVGDVGTSWCFERGVQTEFVRVTNGADCFAQDSPVLWIFPGDDEDQCLNVVDRANFFAAARLRTDLATRRH